MRTSSRWHGARHESAVEFPWSENRRSVKRARLDTPLCSPRIGNPVSSSLKDFKTIYREQGAYHRQAEGFKAWFLEDNYRAITSRWPAHGEILDLACGEGCLADGIGEQRLVGVDYSPDALRLNRELCGRYAELHLGDM